MSSSTSKAKETENKTKNLQITVKTKPRRIGLSNKDRSLIRLQNEYKKWEQLLFSLRQATNYLLLKEEETAKKKIILWRSYAQSIANALYPYYQEYRLSTYWYGDELTHYDDTKGETVQEDEKNMDGMAKMLHELHIDPETIHYSLEMGDFYWQTE